MAITTYARGGELTRESAANNGNPLTPIRLAILNPIIPDRPCGVFDFTIALTRALEHSLGWAVDILPVGVQRAALQEDFKYIVGQQSATAVADALDSLYGSGDGFQSILLQYSGYGLAKSGAPGYLVEGLERFKHGHPNVSVLTYFHELYAVSTPWRRAFWNTRRQRQVVRGLVSLSDYCFTNCAANEQRLLGEFGMEPGMLKTIPVFSNVGEPRLRPDELRDRVPKAVVFGSPGTRERAFSDGAPHLARILDQFEIDTIVEIGGGASQAPDALKSRVDFIGVQDEACIAKSLREARIGFISYPWNYLGKSGVLAAYQAYGVPAVNLAPWDQTQAGTAWREIGIASIQDLLQIEASGLPEIGGVGIAHYRTHDVDAIARAVASALHFGIKVRKQPA